jgi:hypothetical protein
MLGFIGALDEVFRGISTGKLARDGGHINKKDGASRGLAPP